MRRRIPRLVGGAPAQVLVELVWPHALARIHFIERIPDRLELGEGLDQLVAVHDRQQLAAGLPIAVLARERTAVFDDEMRRFGDKAAVLRDAFGGKKIEIDAAVHATLAEVAVKRSHVAKLLHQIVELAQVIADPIRRHGCIFPARIEIRFSGNLRRRTEARFAHVPELSLFRPIVEPLHRRRIRLRFEGFHQPVRALVGLFLGVAAEFDDQPGVAFGKHRAALDRHSFVVHVVEHARIEAFERDRVMRVAESHVIAGGKDVGKSKYGERAARRARHDSKRRFDNSDACAFRPISARAT